jgi:mitochondrial import inner membrane translocase subunit TIM23
MSVWDAFTGKKKQATSPPEPQPQSSAVGYAPSPVYTPSVTDANSFLGAASLPDASQLHPLAGLNQQTLDYLSLDESSLSDLPGGQSVLPSRGWSDDLCYGTGSVYLAALTAGGAWGLIEGLNRTPASAPPKLRLNSVLNTVTRRGPFMGNSAGVVAMCYNGINSTIGYYRGRHDAANSVAAGVLSGMVFRSTKGPKQMLISGVVVGTIAAGWTVSTHAVNKWSMLMCSRSPGEWFSNLLKRKTSPYSSTTPDLPLLPICPPSRTFAFPPEMAF